MVGSDAQQVNYADYFSYEARELKASALADLVNAFQGVPDVITLHAGLPSVESFPLTSLCATTPHTTQGPPSCQPPSSDTQPPGSTAQPQLEINISGHLLQEAQQYMFHAGHPPLLTWARAIAARCHQPPNPVDCVITSGAVNALACAISCLCDKGDYVICEEFAYTHAPECVFIPRGLTMLPVAMDGDGMIPASLRQVLASTPPSPVTGRPPRVMYIIPSGQNPTGAVMPVHRKREIYNICRQAGIIILEDDAYYWLQYHQGEAVQAADQPGLQLPASFLSLDVDSRVLRIDTFAKLLGPGYRLGWVTGAPQLVHKLAQSVQAGSCGPCSFTQVVVSQMFEHWGEQGFEAFVQRQQALYARRAALAVKAASTHLQGLATWQEPRAGMFMWFKLTSLPDVDDQLIAQLVTHRVVMVPGRPFWTDITKARGGAPCPYFRITFGTVPEQQMDEGFKRLAAAITGAMAACPTSLPTTPGTVSDGEVSASEEGLMQPFCAPGAAPSCDESCGSHRSCGEAADSAWSDAEGEGGVVAGKQLLGRSCLAGVKEGGRMQACRSARSLQGLAVALSVMSTEEGVNSPCDRE